MKKTNYILDSNVMIHQILPLMTFEEGDQIILLQSVWKDYVKKCEKNLLYNEQTKNALKLNLLLLSHFYGKGIARVVSDKSVLIEEYLDNQLLLYCQNEQKRKNRDIVLVSNDIQLRMKADITGIKTFSL